MRSLKTTHKALSSGKSSLTVFAMIIGIIFATDQVNMALIDHDYDWHEGTLEGACLAALCVPLLWFLAFQPLRRALSLQQQKSAQLESAHAELAFIHTAFQDSESKYSKLFENSTLGIYQINVAGDLLTVNPAYIDLLGYASRGEALKADHVTDYLTPGRHQELIQAAGQAGGAIRYESQVRRRDGRAIWVCESLRPSYDVDGTVRFYDGTIQDITQQKLAEETEAAYHKTLQAVINNIPQFIFWKDTRSIYLGCNRNFAHLVGLEDPQDVLGRSDFELFSQEDAEAFRSADERVMRGDTPEGVFVENWFKNDVPYWTETSKLPLHDAAGNVIGVLVAATDITERIRSEELLREREAALRRTNSLLMAQQEANLDALLIVDEAQRIVRFNEHFCEMWQVPATLAKAGDDDPFLHHVLGQVQNADAFLAKVDYLYANTSEHSYDEIFLLDGRILERRSVPVTGQDGQNNGRVWQFRDVTERIQVQEDLRASQEMLRMVMDSVPQNILWKNRAGVIVGCNQNFARLHGLTASEMIGHSILELNLPIAKDVATRFDQADDTTMADGQAQYHVVESLVVPNGERKWSDFSRIPLHDAAGNVTGLLVSFEDITERIRAQEGLHASREMLRTVMDNIPQMIFWKDINSVYMGCNEKFTRIAGLEHPEDLVGKTDFDLPWNPEDKEWFHKIDRRVMDTDTPELRRVDPHPQPDGTVNWAEANKIPLHDGSGRVVGMLGTLENITERKRTEADLLQAKDQAEAASRAKSQFLANMSHELRTPMNAVIGFSEILQDEAFGPLNPRQAKYVGNILNSGRHLLQLINDILDITKIEAGRMTLDREPLAVAEVVEGVYSVVKALSMKKKIEIFLEIEDGMPLIHADSACFKKILYNLFSNAIKFTPESGQVRLKAWHRDAVLNISICDTGIGIAPEDQARIWGEFEQVDSTFARTQQGTGLGLSLTRRLVELHEGRIWMESEGIGKGSAFHFTIPLRSQEVHTPPPTVAATPAPSKAEADGSRPWVLLVDDDSQASELMTHCLEDVGYAVSRADDGDQGLFLALLSRPCVVLLDIEMPGKDGWEVLSELKADPRTQDIPVVIVSVNNDRARALHLGAVDCFAKPVDRATLVQTLRRLQSTTPGAGPALPEKSRINA